MYMYIYHMRLHQTCVSTNKLVGIVTPMLYPVTIPKTAYNYSLTKCQFEPTVDSTVKSLVSMSNLATADLKHIVPHTCTLLVHVP